MTALHPSPQTVRSQLRKVTLEARSLLVAETRDILTGIYGVSPAGQFENIVHLPALASSEAAVITRQLLERYIKDKQEVGIASVDAVSLLTREVAFTWLNRIAAFKLLEARSLMRQSVSRGADSNGYKLWLANEEQNALAARIDAGGGTNDLGETPQDTAYRLYLLDQCAIQARDIRILFDTDTLASRLFPRPRALAELLALVNADQLTPAWNDDETIGWIYQFFNAEEKDHIFDKLNKGQKAQADDIPAATQLFTPRWIVQALVENSLGRLWLQMHPDSMLGKTWNSLVPECDAPPLPMRQVREITLLDPACGTMHFGLVAFDLFYAMYLEELECAGKVGWPSTPSVRTEAEIAGAIIEHNLFGMDIDLRAVQLSALTLLIKARSRNKDAHITDHNLACASVVPPSLAHLDAFLAEAQFSQPIYSRLVRGIWQKLRDAPLLGSLMRLEDDLDAMIKEERIKSHTPSLPGFDINQFETEAGTTEYWDIIAGQVVRTFDEFAARHEGEFSERYFTGEASKGFHLFQLMLRRYDVIVTNPPYLDSRDFSLPIKNVIEKHYPKAKRNLYAAFTLRCLELAKPQARIAMLTPHTFMAISSFEDFRLSIRQITAIELLVDTDYGTIEGVRVDCCFFVLRREPSPSLRDSSTGTYLRLVREPDAVAKQQGFSHVIRTMSNGETDARVYRYRQGDFDAIPGAPWVYYITPSLRDLFKTLPKLNDIAPPRQGLATSDNFRFLRRWWEVGQSKVYTSATKKQDAIDSKYLWFPYMKGGEFKRWWGNQDYIINWKDDGSEIRNFDIESGNPASVIRNAEYYYQRGVTYSFLTSAVFNARLSPGGFIFDVAGSSLFPTDIFLFLAILNSSFAHYTLKLLNPTVNFQVGDMARLPIPTQASDTIHALVERAITVQQLSGTEDETTYEFVAPPDWLTGLTDLEKRASELATIEAEIDAEVYRLYGISDADQAIIAAELDTSNMYSDDTTAQGEEVIDDENNDSEERVNQAKPTRRGRGNVQPHDPEQELALRWISYAVGIVLGRFQPGVDGALGSGRIDEAATRAQLCQLAISGGIATFENGRADDLADNVWHAMELLLGATQAEAVITCATGGQDLRAWLIKEYINDHITRYRSRPIYWLIQSPSRKRYASYMIFQERITADTLSQLLSPRYLSGRLSRVTDAISMLEKEWEVLDNPRDKHENAEKVTRLREEHLDLIGLQERLVAITTQTDDQGKTVGWRPERDDGVFINLAPLHSVMPTWAKEPRTCWAKLEQGEYDWSHTAMRYWPVRVRLASEHNRSFAIAHDLPLPPLPVIEGKRKRQK